MDVDADDRLWVAGGPTGKVFLYDADEGAFVRTIDPPEAERTFLNDLVATGGAVYVTDSFRPVLFRIPLAEDGPGEIESWLDLEGTPIEYQTGETTLEQVNLNGIAATEDGRYLITAQMNTGELFRIATDTKEITPIDLGGETLVNADGLVLDERTLYVVRIADNEIVVVELSDDLVSGEITARYTSDALAWPATAALAGDRLLVVNTQFNRQGEGSPPPELPFRVLGIPVSAIQQGQP